MITSPRPRSVARWAHASRALPALRPTRAKRLAAFVLGAALSACAYAPELDDLAADPTSRPDAAAVDAGARVDGAVPNDGGADATLSLPDAVDAGDASDAADGSVDLGPDGGDGGDGGPVVGDWSPGALGSGLALWLDAREGVTLTSQRVSAWQDRSSNGFSATQPTTTARPEHAPSAINGHPVVRFPRSTHLRVVDAPPLRLGTGDFYVAVVARHTTPSAGGDTDDHNGLLVLKSETTLFPYAGVALFANFNRTGPSSALGVQVDHAAYARTGSAGYNDGRAFLLGARRVGARLEARVNGAVVGATSGATTDVSAPGAPLFLGGRNDGRQFLTGDIAEVVVHRGPLPDADLGKLEAYLRTKYAL